MNEVVVTGLGWVTPMGRDVESVWKRLLAGDVAVDHPKAYGDATPPTGAIAEVPHADVAALREAFPEAAGDRRTLFGVAAGAAALENAGLVDPHERAGVFLGSGPGIHRFDDIAAALDADGAFDPSRFAANAAAIGSDSLLRNRAERPAVLLARRFGLCGPVHAVTTACTAANQALGMGYRSVQRGECDYVVAGGADSMVNPQGLIFFVLLGASANVDNDAPAQACRPFDRRRSGLVMGEGAGCLVLESAAHAKARGATILARAVGYGASLDAWRTTAPPPDGRGAAEAMDLALRDADMAPEDVDFVNAHGTGTKRNDPAEVQAVRRCFGDHAETLAMSSSKGALGHLLSAAAGVAAVSCVLAIRDGRVPPTVNLTEPDAQCDLNHVPGVAEQRPVRAAMNNAFAFGGQNACFLLARPDHGAAS